MIIAAYSIALMGEVQAVRPCPEFQMESEDEHNRFWKAIWNVNASIAAYHAALLSGVQVEVVCGTGAVGVADIESTRSDGRIQCNSNVDVNSRPREMILEAFEDLVR